MRFVRSTVGRGAESRPKRDRDRRLALRCERLEDRVLLATTSISSGSWDDPATWDNGVPDATERAIIAPGFTVDLDGIDHIAKELVVQGELRAVEAIGGGATKSLTANWIHVNSGGVLQIGAETDRYDENEFVITLTGNDPTQTFNIEGVADPVTNNDAFLMVAGGGRLQFFGEEKLSYTKLAATAEVGATQILVEDVIDRDFNGVADPAVDGVVNWSVGDEIVIASSSYDYQEEEVRTITAISDQPGGKLLTLNFALDHRHYGEIETYSNSTRSWDLDLRAEVAVLNRTIQIQGVAAEDTDRQFGDRQRYDLGLSEGFGGHTMIMESAGQITIDGVRFDKMGQTGRIGRYPIHWHVAIDRTGDVLRNSSITNSNNRGVTVHGTLNLLLEDNVLHDIHGHGFFMEDGVETGNQFLRNIVLGIHKVGGDDTSTDPFIVDTHDTAQQIDNRFLQSAAFWITNPDNTWIGNVSAGSEGTGYWFILPSQPIGLSSQVDAFNGISARTTDLGIFDYNSSHSSPVGLTFDRGSDIDPGSSDTYQPATIPVVNYFTGYKHDGAALYHRALEGIFNENMYADSATGSFNTFSQEVHNSLFVGHSRGNADLSQPVTGHSLYDGPSVVVDSHFAGFGYSNSHMFRANGGAQKRTHHMVSGITFEDDGSADHVSISGRLGETTIENSPASYSSVVYDVDGSLTGAVGGGPGWTVVPDNPFMYDRDGTDFKPTGWNSWVTDNLYAELNIRTAEGAATMAAMEYTSPARQVATISNTETINRIALKLDDGFYSISFPNDTPTSVEPFRIRLEVFSGTPANGSTMLRYVGIGQTMTPDDGVEVFSWADLEASTQDAFYRADDNLWLKRFISEDFVTISPNAPAAATSPPAAVSSSPAPPEVNADADVAVTASGATVEPEAFIVIDAPVTPTAPTTLVPQAIVEIPAVVATSATVVEPSQAVGGVAPTLTAAFILFAEDEPIAAAGTSLEGEATGGSLGGDEELLLIAQELAAKKRTAETPAAEATALSADFSTEPAADSGKSTLSLRRSLDEDDPFSWR